MKPRYNGWANRQTWNVALWLGNDEGMYRQAREWARSTHGRITASMARDFVADMMPYGTPDNVPLSGVRWGEIAADLEELR